MNQLVIWVDFGKSISRAFAHHMGTEQSLEEGPFECSSCTVARRVLHSSLSQRAALPTLLFSSSTPLSRHALPLND